MSVEDLPIYAHDSAILSNLIDRQIANDYKNKSFEIIVNCADLMNNPTQEFYTRHLTEIHKSTGLNDLGGIKWELVGCLLLVFISVYFALWKGIKSAGKVGFISLIIQVYKKKCIGILDVIIFSMVTFLAEIYLLVVLK